MTRTFWLKRETDGARLLETKSGFEFWVPRSVCRRTLKFPPNADGKRAAEVEIEDWWWEKNGTEAKEAAQGQRKLQLCQQFRWKVMDVAFADNLRNPRRLILEVNTNYPNHCYTTCGEDGFGSGSHSDHSLRTLDEWLVWIDRFSDELTGRELRECKEAARAPFTEPAGWAGYRKRYAETGDPWIEF